MWCGSLPVKNLASDRRARLLVGRYALLLGTEAGLIIEEYKRGTRHVTALPVSSRAVVGSGHTAVRILDLVGLGDG